MLFFFQVGNLTLIYEDITAGCKAIFQIAGAAENESTLKRTEQPTPV